MLPKGHSGSAPSQALGLQGSRDMTEAIKGTLYAHFETGTEGIVWCLEEDGKLGYDGLHWLAEGDYLKILGTDGAVLWEGMIDFDYKANLRPIPTNPIHQKQAVHGYWVNGLQRGVPPATWSAWFHERKRALLTPKAARGDELAGPSAS